MYKNFIFVICLIVCFVEKSFSDEYTDLITQRNALKEQISAVDSEIARCEKSMKEKLFDELDKTLTFTEKQRLKEIYESSGNIEGAETDRSLLQKVSAAAQKSQKEKGK